MTKRNLKQLVEQLTDEVLKEKQVQELSPATYKSAIDKSYQQNRPAKADKFANAGMFREFVGKTLKGKKIEKFKVGKLALEITFDDSTKISYISDMSVSKEDVSWGPATLNTSKSKIALERKDVVLLLKIIKTFNDKTKLTPQSFTIYGDHVDEKTIVASTDGTKKTLTGDQKKKVQTATDSGDDVEIRKKGAPLEEKDAEVSNNKVPNDRQYMIDFMKGLGFQHTNWNSVADDDLRNMYGIIKKDSKTSNAKMNEAEEPAEQQVEPAGEIQETPQSIIPVIKLIDQAHDTLEQIVKTSQEKRYVRYAEAAIKHLENAHDVLDDIKVLEEKAAAKKAADDEKLDVKHVDKVRKHLSKKVKDKKDVEPIMKKYDKVARKLRVPTGDDPVKSADLLWKHILKEEAQNANLGGNKKSMTTSDGVQIKPGLKVITNDMIKGTVQPWREDGFDGWFTVKLDNGQTKSYDGSRLSTTDPFTKQKIN